MIKDKILGFKKLKEGWCYTEGVIFKDAVIEKALVLLDIIGNHKTNAFPGINGEIELNIYKKAHFLEITIEPNELVTCVCEINNEELFYKENLTWEEAIEQVISFCK
jgi:fumarate hydratase class II